MQRLVLSVIGREAIAVGLMSPVLKWPFPGPLKDERIRREKTAFPGFGACQHSLVPHV